MDELFRGWGRKIGCVTLFLALVFMGLWIRGLAFFECVVVPGRETYSVFWSSHRKITNYPGIAWERWWDDSTASPNKIIWTQWKSWSTPTEAQIEENARVYAAYKKSSEWAESGTWEWELYGLIVGASRSHIILGVPFWSITIPLTLISAWLLLTKPGQATQKKIHESTAIEGSMNHG